MVELSSRLVLIPPSVRRGAELRAAAQTGAAAAVSFVLATALGLPHPYWSVISAIVVTQSSVGSGVLGVARDRAAGTVVGAVVGAAAAFVRPEGFAAMTTTLALVAAVLAFLGAGRSWLKVAPVTAAIVIAGAAGPEGPASLAIDRMLEIMVGSLVGVGAILLLFPRHAHLAFRKQARDSAGKAGALLQEIIRGADRDPADIRTRHADLKKKLDALTTAAGAVIDLPGQQRDGANRAALARASWRVRSDIVILGRAFQADEPGVDLTGWAAAAARAVGRLEALSRGEEAEPLGDPPIALGLTGSGQADDSLARAAAAIGLAHLYRDLDDLSERFVDLKLVQPRRGAVETIA